MDGGLQGRTGGLQCWQRGWEMLHVHPWPAVTATNRLSRKRSGGDGGRPGVHGVAVAASVQGMGRRGDPMPKATPMSLLWGSCAPTIPFPGSAPPVLTRTGLCRVMGLSGLRAGLGEQEAAED